MIIKDGFVLRKVPGMNIVMPAGSRISEYRKTVVLNDSAAFIFEILQNGASPEEAAEALLKEYEIDAETASKAVEQTIADLEKAGLTVE